MQLRPATFFDALDFAGHRAFLRKVLVYQVRHGEAFVVEQGTEKLALGMFWRDRARRAEFALSVRPLARVHMVGLVRLAHLTIARVVQGGCMVFARVRMGDARGQRMARLVGFVPGRMRNPEIWIFARCQNGNGEDPDGRNNQGGEEAGSSPGFGPPAG